MKYPARKEVNLLYYSLDNLSRIFFDSVIFTAGLANIVAALFATLTSVRF
jgi:hypothetical protein